MMRKAKVIRKPRAKTHSKAELVNHIAKMKAELEGAQQVITAMQNEIKQLTSMHRTQLQIIDNLSTRIRDND